MKELLIELADALDDTRAGGDRRRAKLAVEARALARGPLAICAIGATGSGKTVSLRYVAEHLTERGFESYVAQGSRERIVFSDSLSVVDAFLDCPPRQGAPEIERRALFVELASFDTTRFPGMEAEAVRQAERFGLDPIDLLLACESIFKAGLGEVQAANDAENGDECRCGRGGFGCCEDT